MTMTPEAQYRKAFSAYNEGITLAEAGSWGESQKLFAKAFKLHRENARYALFLGASLWHSGQEDLAVEFWSHAANMDPMVRVAQFHPQADEFTRQMSRLADNMIRDTLTKVQNNAVDQTKNPGRIKSAIWPQTHQGDVEYPGSGPRPFMFYVPEFPEVPVFDRRKMDWTTDLEKATDVIRDEYLSLVNTGFSGDPYVHAGSAMGPEWEKLKGQDKWTSVHLYKDGAPTSRAEMCPETIKVLRNAPLVYHKGNPMEVFFSVLKPGTHIPPHFGLSNTRLTVHLPLIIPEDCSIRVHDAKYTWREGETFLFDDSFDHEAWNRSGETRVVLIFEAWRPDMTDGEIQAVEASYAARQQWLVSRRMPDIEKMISGAR